MSLNNIELKDQLISELYRGNLLATEGFVRPPAPAGPAIPSPALATEPAPPVITPINYKFLGNNRRHIAIVVQSPGIAFLPDDQLSFLGKMLEACKMNMGDVAIVNHATHPVQIAALKQQLQPSFLLLFGLGPVDIRLPMNFPVFTIHNYDQCTYLGSPSLGELLQPGDEGKLLKSKLWVSLKTLFEI